MKQPKKLTKQQEVIISSHGYNPDDYCYLEETGLSYVFVRKDSGQKLWIEKGKNHENTEPNGARTPKNT